MMAPSLGQQKSPRNRKVPAIMLTASSEDMMSGCSSSPSPPTPSSGLSRRHGASSSVNGGDKSQFSSMSDGENFECYGEGVDLELGPAGCPANVGDGVDRRSPNNSTSAISRHSWSRTSLRRVSPSHNENLPNRRWGSMRHSGKRQLGSNALASQLYRSSSFNSSERSSLVDGADATEDMYSDVSVEEDVMDLNHKYQVLQRQMDSLADSQSTIDDRYHRYKTDNAVLQARVLMLEEQLREFELKSEERLQEEQRRHREIIVRVEREAQLQVENGSMRLQAMELEATSLRSEVTRSRAATDKVRAQLEEAEDRIEGLMGNLALVQRELEDCRERENKYKCAAESSELLIDDLSREVERLRNEYCRPAMPSTAPEQIRLEELHEEMNVLRQNNKNLEEANEELQAIILNRSVEEGRTLLNGTTSGSLAAEFEAMSHDQCADCIDGIDNMAAIELQKTMRDLQEENTRLRCYIDDILLNIVENYPQLLEVKKR